MTICQQRALLRLYLIGAAAVWLFFVAALIVSILRCQAVISGCAATSLVVTSVYIFWLCEHDWRLKKCQRMN